MIEQVKIDMKFLALQLSPTITPQGFRMTAEEMKDAAEVLYQWLIKDL